MTGMLTMPFRLDPKKLSALSAEDAILRFRDLLLAEAALLKIPVTSINVPDAVTTADGGIDASVHTEVKLPTEGILSTAITRFQVKTGESFSAWQPAAIKKELFGDSPAAKENLGPAVRTCMDSGGTYVLVCMGYDLVEKNVDDARGHLQAAFEACGYTTPRVKVLGRGQIAALVDHHLGLVRHLMGSDFGGCRDHASWAKDQLMEQPFVADTQQTALIEQIRAALRGEDTRHIRLWGEPGIGKTRLTLEATKVDDLAPRVLYCVGHELQGSALYTSLQDQPTLTGILVVDECDTAVREWISDRLHRFKDRLRIISIYQEPDNASGLHLLNAPVLDDAAIVQIIQSYGLPAEEARRWSELCDGSPRVAHVIGANGATDSEDMLKPPSAQNIWERYAVGARHKDDPNAQQLMSLMRRVALFQKFGYERPVQEEGVAIAGMVSFDDNRITPAIFNQWIKELRDRRVLQGDRTLYITPKALHIWLWSEWWDRHSHGFRWEDFQTGLVGKLKDWFVGMWKYAHRSKAAVRVVEQLCGPEGPFADGTLLRTEIGADFLLALTDASPEAVLNCLERTVGAWSNEEIESFEIGRSEVRFALERIVVWRALFLRGARLLLALAVAENERWSNNASGVFASLFSPGFGGVAPSEASPEERFPLLREAVTSDNPKQRRIGIKASDSALVTDHFSRMSNADYQGLRMPPNLWKPKVWGEVFEAYLRVWTLLEQRAAEVSTDERAEILRVMLGRASGLARMRHISPQIIATLSGFAERGWVTPKVLIEWCEDFLELDEGERIGAELIQTIEQLRDKLMGEGLQGRIHRFIGLQRIRDNYEDGKRTGRWEEIANGIAVDAMKQTDVLVRELPWLNSKDAENAWAFGYRIGVRDISCSLLPEIEAAWGTNTEKYRSILFLAGYLKAVFERDAVEFESILDRWATNAARVASVPELMWRSGMTDKLAERWMVLIRSGVVPVATLGMLRFGRTIDSIDEKRFLDMIALLVGPDLTCDVHLAVDLLHTYYEPGRQNKPFPLKLVQQVLTDPRLLQRKQTARDVTAYEWTRLATALFAAEPESGPSLLDAILNDVRSDRSFTREAHSEEQSLTSKIFAADAEASWAVLEKHLHEPEARWSVLAWVGGQSPDEDGSGLWASVPLEKLWSWIGKNPSDRGPDVARCIPKALSAKGMHPITRELLVRCGADKNVRQSLVARYLTGSWWGHASQHYEGMRKVMVPWREGESNANVGQWLDEMTETLKELIESARVREERDY